MLREIAGAWRSTRRRGLRATAGLLASEVAFDFRYGTETRRVLEGGQLGPLAEGRSSDGQVYHAVNPAVFRAAMARAAERVGAPPWAGSFVDFGSGKGRGLILAAAAGYREVIGVEHSARLNEIAASNLRAVERRFRPAVSWQLHCIDAARFQVPDDSTLWFCFNPFDADTTAAVAHRMLESWGRRYRRACLVYANPVHAAAVCGAGFRIVEEVAVSRRHVDALLFEPVAGASHRSTDAATSRLRNPGRAGQAAGG